MSGNNTSIIVAEKNGKVRNFSKATWDLLPNGKMGYSIVKDLPELNETKGGQEKKEVSTDKVEKKPKHPAFEKPKKAEKKEAKKEEGKKEEHIAVDPLKDIPTE